MEKPWSAVFAGDDTLEQARLVIAAYFRSLNLPARAHLAGPLQWAWKNSGSKPKRSDCVALNWNRRPLAETR